MQASERVAPAASASAGARPFYRYTDDRGRLHIVDSWSEVPESLRVRAQRVELAAREQVPAARPIVPARVDWPSFGVGFATALVACGIWWLARGRLGLVSKLVLSAVVVAVLGALYLGLLRRESGLSSDLVSRPGALIDDARRAAEQVRARNQRQDDALRQIEREAK